MFTEEPIRVQTFPIGEIQPSEPNSQAERSQPSPFILNDPEPLLETPCSPKLVAGGMEGSEIVLSKVASPVASPGKVVKKRQLKILTRSSS